MLLTGRLNFIRFIIYVGAQTLGAFLGAALVTTIFLKSLTINLLKLLFFLLLLKIYFVYLDALIDYKPGMYSLDAAGK